MLKQLRLEAELKALNRKMEEITSKRVSLTARENELAAALEQAESGEDFAALENRIKELEKDIAALDAEKTTEELKKKTDEIKKQIEEIGAPSRESAHNENERKASATMKTRGIFKTLTPERRNAVLADVQVKEFLTRARELICEKRSIKGAELAFPVTILDILRENVALYSKLYNHINTVSANGTARRLVAGAVPEGIWTETVGAINELNLDFSLIETDGYKVAGLFVIDNSTYEDADDVLLSLIIEYLSAAVGQALDKAIVYGSGNKMPLGFVTRLAQAAQPAAWSANAPEWTDLHEKNIIKLNLGGETGEEFFAKLITALTAANPKKNGANNKLFWVMNRKTHMDLITRTVKFNAAAALVAASNDTMPVIGGDIIELEFMADYDIAGGYGAVYTLAERAGYSMATSGDVKFIEDRTVFKGTARYDGKPVFGEGFVLVNYANIAPTVTVAFAADSANTDRVALSELSIGTQTLFPCSFDKDVLNYSCNVTSHTHKITALAADQTATVEIKNGEATVKSGTNATFTAGENTVTITVTNGNAAARVYTVIVNDQTSGS